MNFQELLTLMSTNDYEVKFFLNDNELSLDTIKIDQATTSYIINLAFDECCYNQSETSTINPLQSGYDLSSDNINISYLEDKKPEEKQSKSIKDIVSELGPTFATSESKKEFDKEYSRLQNNIDEYKKLIEKEKTMSPAPKLDLDKIKSIMTMLEPFITKKG